jgi:hypothetical protein
MTEGQSKAYRLADELENTPFDSTRHEAAAELRRLYEENQSFLAVLEFAAAQHTPSKASQRGKK